jgi:hypothetical protein
MHVETTEFLEKIAEKNCYMKQNNYAAFVRHLGRDTLLALLPFGSRERVVRWAEKFKLSYPNLASNVVVQTIQSIL